MGLALHVVSNLFADERDRYWRIQMDIAKAYATGTQEERDALHRELDTLIDHAMNPGRRMTATDPRVH